MGRLLRSQRVNAAAGWTLIGLVVLTGLGSLLAGEWLWAILTAIVALIAAAPAIQLRSAWVLPPWEVMLLAALSTLAHLLATLWGSTLFTGRVTAYVSVAALALLIAVDLDVFTPVRMNDAFAVLFVVVATMATAGIWAVVRWTADLALHTGFLGSERALMLEFVASTVAGLGAGVLYVLYVRRRARPELRVPEEVRLP